MGYQFRSRLRHVANRMSEVNQSCGYYIRGTSRFQITVGPILIASDELNPGGVSSLVRVERQDFAIWRCDSGPNGEIGLGSFYPPRPGDKIEWDNQTFAASSMGTDEPCFTHTESNRERLIVHTVRIEA